MEDIPYQVNRLEILGFLKRRRHDQGHALQRAREGRLAEHRAQTQHMVRRRVEEVALEFEGSQGGGPQLRKQCDHVRHGPSAFQGLQIWRENWRCTGILGEVGKPKVNLLQVHGLEDPSEDAVVQCAQVRVDAEGTQLLHAQQ